MRHEVLRCLVVIIRLLAFPVARLLLLSLVMSSPFRSKILCIFASR